MSNPRPLPYGGGRHIVLLLSNFFWVACFLFPRSLAFDLCYDLDIWGQGQVLRAFFVVMSFFTILLKV